MELLPESEGKIILFQNKEIWNRSRTRRRSQIIIISKLLSPFLSLKKKFASSATLRTLKAFCYSYYRMTENKIRKRLDAEREVLKLELS